MEVGLGMGSRLAPGRRAGGEGSAKLKERLEESEEGGEGDIGPAFLASILMGRGLARPFLSIHW